jgi:hypothetical protein
LQSIAAVEFRRLLPELCQCWIPVKVSDGFPVGNGGAISPCFTPLFSCLSYHYVPGEQRACNMQNMSFVSGCRFSLLCDGAPWLHPTLVRPVPSARWCCCVAIQAAKAGGSCYKSLSHRLSSSAEFCTKSSPVRNLAATCPATRWSYSVKGRPSVVSIATCQSVQGNRRCTPSCFTRKSTVT